MVDLSQVSTRDLLLELQARVSHREVSMAYLTLIDSGLYVQDDSGIPCYFLPWTQYHLSQQPTGDYKAWKEAVVPWSQ